MFQKLPIGSFAIVGAGQGAPQKQSDFSKEGYPFIRAGYLEELIEGKSELDLPKVNNDISKSYRLKLYKPGTIIFAKSGMSATKGRIYKLKNHCYIVNHLATLELQENAHPDYILYALHKYSPVKLINDSAYPSISQSVIEKYSIPLPPLEDQIRIAILLSRIEELIAKRRESIRLLDEFVKSTFLEMFGTPSNNHKNFNTGKINDLVSEVKYGTSSPSENEGRYPYLRMNNITINGHWDFSDLKYINISDDDKEKYILRFGDLVFNRTNSKELVGKTAVYNRHDEMVIAGYLIRGRVNKKANSWFIWGHLNSAYGKKVLFNLCRNIVGMANINAQELKNIKILCPPVEIQNKFAIIVEKIETIKTKYQESLSELEKLYGAVSQRAFRGEI